MVLFSLKIRYDSKKFLNETDESEFKILVQTTIQNLSQLIRLMNKFKSQCIPFKNKFDEIISLYQVSVSSLTNEYHFKMKPSYELKFSDSSKYKIYKGIRKSDRLPVAIKIIPKNAITEWKYEQILPFEIYSMLLIRNNENYIQLIDYEIKSNNVYIIMSLPDNICSLSYFIKKHTDNERQYQHLIDYIFCKVLFSHKNLTLRKVLILDIDCSIQFHPNDLFRIKDVLITNFSPAIEYDQNRNYDKYLGRFEYSSYMYNKNKTYQADTALAWSFGIFMYFLKNKRYRFKNDHKLDEWCNSYLKGSLIGSVASSSNIQNIHDIWNENFYDFSPFKIDNNKFIYSIRNFHANETRYRRNNFQTNNIKYKNTRLIEGLIRIDVPVLMDEIDLKLNISKFKPTDSISFNENLNEFCLHVTYKLKATDYFVQILSHYNLLRENRIFLLMEHIGYDFEMFKRADFYDLNRNQVIKITDKLIEAIIDMRKNYNILYLDDAGIFINKKTFQVKFFYNYNILHVEDFRQVDRAVLCLYETIVYDDKLMNKHLANFIWKLLEIMIKNLSNMNRKEKKKFLNSKKMKYEIYCYLKNEILNVRKNKNFQVQIFKSNLGNKSLGTYLLNDFF